MKITRIIGVLFFLALLGGGYYIYNQASNLQYPEFVRIQNIKFKNVTLPPNIKVTFVSDAIINNPNPHSLTIAGADFDVYVEDKKVTNVKQELEVKMPANSEFALPLSFEIPLKSKSFFKNFTSDWKKTSIKIRSVGTITIKEARVKFDIPFDYDDEYRLEDYLK